MNEGERVRWVQMQADCLLPRLFANLYKVVEEDLREANQCSPFVEQGFMFLLDPSPFDGKCQFTVTRSPAPDSMDLDARVTFTWSKQGIAIVRHMPDQTKHTLHVKAQWDHDSETCGITINGERNAKKEFYKPWQISREALSPLIFP